MFLSQEIFDKLFIKEKPSEKPSYKRSFNRSFACMETLACFQSDIVRSGICSISMLLQEIGSTRDMVMALGAIGWHMQRHFDQLAAHARNCSALRSAIRADLHQSMKTAFPGTGRSLESLAGSALGMSVPVNLTDSQAQNGIDEIGRIPGHWQPAGWNCRIDSAEPSMEGTKPARSSEK